MPKKYHLNVKTAPARFVAPGSFGIIEADGCLNCSNCVKKVCVYSVYSKRGYDRRQMFDTADSLCKNCFRCVQGCYARILSKSKNPAFWAMGDAYWTPEIIATIQNQAETGKIPVSGGGYGGPFAGDGFDSMWTDMSEIVRPTRDGIHGREYISTGIELGRVLKRVKVEVRDRTFGAAEASTHYPPRVEASIPILFDLLPFGDFSPSIRLGLARAAQEANTLMILRAEQVDENLLPLANHLVPLLPEGPLERFLPQILKARMVQVPFGPEVRKRIEEVKGVNPRAVVSVRIPLTPRIEDEATGLLKCGADVLHIHGDARGREHQAEAPRFIKDQIRRIHLALIREGRRDEMSLVFGGGIALAEHVAKAIICGADAVAIERPLLIACECRLCEPCLEKACPVDLEKSTPDWGRQRVVNLLSAWHGQLLEVLGAMGLRDVRRLRGEVGRAIFLEEIEKETFGRIFAEPVKTAAAPAQETALPGEDQHVFPS